MHNGPFPINMHSVIGYEPALRKRVIALCAEIMAEEDEPPGPPDTAA